ncbi:hypothetical protein E2C01_077195 [Portunus trituberculatus]|uniref:Uncharacterized protein n=1 Tax=Portunus trituberculatus TaxID=210409 RepID=A0A5B7IJP7_PORTR|nr:hypothetical protein [Portunus trituberculatus]
MARQASKGADRGATIAQPPPASQPASPSPPAPPRPVPSALPVRQDLHHFHLFHFFLQPYTRTSRIPASTPLPFTMDYRDVTTKGLTSYWITLQPRGLLSKQHLWSLLWSGSDGYAAEVCHVKCDVVKHVSSKLFILQSSAK